jgi:hypothetical protein
MPAARSEIVIAMDDRGAGGREQRARRHRVERAPQETRVPAIEQIARQDQMVGPAGDDAIELALEGAQIGRIADV